MEMVSELGPFPSPASNHQATQHQPLRCSLDLSFSIYKTDPSVFQKSIFNDRKVASLKFIKLYGNNYCFIWDRLGKVRLQRQVRIGILKSVTDLPRPRERIKRAG
jgi:hypothetical protein